MTTKKLDQARVLSALQQVLQERIKDAENATAIYEAVLAKVRLMEAFDGFEKFCRDDSIPDKEPSTLEELKTSLESSFGAGNVTLEPSPEEPKVKVRIATPDHIASNDVRVVPPDAGAEDDDEPTAPFVPFPVAMPGDPELIWSLARREDIAPQAAVEALLRLQDEFWSTKTGRRLLKKGVPGGFPEFILNVSAGALDEIGIKRWSKEPETLKLLAFAGLENGGEK